MTGNNTVTLSLAVLIGLFLSMGILLGLNHFGIINLSKNVQVAIDPATGEKERCPNIPSLVKQREFYNLYVVGRVDPDDEKILPPDRIIITQETLDKTKFALISINSEIVGQLFTTVDQPQIDVGYKGRIYFWNGAEYRLAFKDIPSNWNCENYPSAGDNYRPNGARYLLKIVWNDIDRRTTVDTYEQVVYVRYGGSK